MRTRHLPALSLLLSAALLTACGSTVGVAGGARGSLPTDSSLTGDGLGGTSPTQGTTSAPGGATTGAGLSSAGTGGSTGSTGTVAATTAPVPQVVLPSGSSQGITAKAIYVGFVYDKNAGSVNKAAGVGSITSGDSKADTEAVIKDINTHGGIAGRKLIPVWGQFDSTSAQTLDQQYAALCEGFKHDAPRVFAVDYTAGTASYRECLSKAGVLTLGVALPEIGRDEMQHYSAYIEQGYPNLDRLAAYLPTALAEQKYFTPWDSVRGAPAAAGVVKVGVLTYDNASFSRVVDTVLVPGLKRLGYTPIVEKVAPLSNEASISGQAVAVKSAQIAFASNNVTHVIPFESNGGLSTLFMPVARTQGYYPRYGVNTAAAPEALIESGAVEKRQYAGAVGFGWLPSVDLPTAMNPDNGPYSNANMRNCLKVMHANGISFDSGNSRGIALNICSNVYLLRAAFTGHPASITLRSTLASIEGLGTSYQRAGSLGQQFVPGRKDPTNKVFRYRYFDDCQCMHYTGSLLTIP